MIPSVSTLEFQTLRLNVFRNDIRPNDLKKLRAVFSDFSATRIFPGLS